MPSMPPARLALATLTLGIAALVACNDNGPASSPRVVITPILDSLFVGDTLAARTATYFDARGTVQPSGPVRWSSSDTTVFGVDSSSGQVVGRGGGHAVLSARANGYSGTALLIVSRSLDLSLLLDTIYLMPGDTFTVPVSVRSKSGSPPPVRFHASTNSVFAIDSMTGVVTATGSGGPLAFTAHADTVTVGGAVEVVQLGDTIGGKSYFTILGTAIERTRAGARAVSYQRNGNLASFRLSTPVFVQGKAIENIVITLLSAAAAPMPFAVDSLSPDEAFGSGSDPICRPPRAWGLWTTQAVVPTVHGYSRQGGSITLHQLQAVAHGQAVSGRFFFVGQRGDLYDNPLGALPMRGTFVAPVITDNTQCH